jgi:poly [ADP-ribose] polymerase
VWLWLAQGLRIMPHSGGRVGKGIYLASENSKSAGYVRSDYKSKTGIMFLCEGAMGKEAKIFRDDSSLVKPPKGFDSVLAVGASEPDPSKDATMKIDGKNVVIPQGKVISQTDSLLALWSAAAAGCCRRLRTSPLTRKF